MGASGHRMIAGGNSVVALAITPEPLVDNPTPCVMVWVGAPHDDTGVAQNTSVARLGPRGRGADTTCHGRHGRILYPDL